MWLGVRVPCARYLAELESKKSVCLFGAQGGTQLCYRLIACRVAPGLSQQVVVVHNHSRMCSLADVTLLQQLVAWLSVDTCERLRVIQSWR